MFNSHPNCTRCELHATVIKNVGVPTIQLPSLPPSPTTPAIIFIGMNPGYHEDINNEPFFPMLDPRDGRPNSGYLFRNVYLKPMDWEQTCSLYCTNIVRCGPMPKPPAKSAVACFPYLLADIDTIMQAHHAAKIAVCLLGEYAASQFFMRFVGIKRLTLTEARNLNGNEYFRHFHLSNRSGDAHTLNIAYGTFTTFHPAAVLREEAYIVSVESHLELLDDYLNGTMATPSDPTFIPPRAPRTQPCKMTT